MQVAVLIHCNSLLAAEAEVGMGSGLGLERLAQAAVFGLNIDPLDEVLGDHGMVDGADVDGELVAVDGNDGQVLLAAGVHGIGDEGFHLLAAAHHRHAGIVDHADEVAAVTADIELGFHNETSCKEIIFVPARGCLRSYSICNEAESQADCCAKTVLFFRAKDDFAPGEEMLFHFALLRAIINGIKEIRCTNSEESA